MKNAYAPFGKPTRSEKEFMPRRFKEGKRAGEGKRRSGNLKVRPGESWKKNEGHCKRKVGGGESESREGADPEKKKLKILVIRGTLVALTRQGTSRRPKSEGVRQEKSYTSSPSQPE